jgi:O-antigen ligase
MTDTGPMTDTGLMTDAGPPASRQTAGGSSGDRRQGADAVTVLTVYLVLLCAVPSELTITALGSVGRPATLWGLACAAWWLWATLQRPWPTDRPRSPVRVALAVVLAVALLSYALAQLHGLPPGEVSPADSGLLRLASWSGVALVATDGIRDRQRWHTLLRRVVVAGSVVAALGVAQSLTGRSLIPNIALPGFSGDPGLGEVQSRGEFVRASATASHPLEYAVVLSSALPLAVTFALERARRSSVGPWLGSGLLALASVVSVSRSAIVGLIVGLAPLVSTWGRTVRRVALVVGVGMVAALYVLVPGILGTVRGLFSSVGADPSTLSRTSSYGTALQIAAHDPVTGRGFGTFLPQYRILDNQYLLLLVELGALGLAAFAGLLVTTITCVIQAERSATERLDRQLARALLGSLLAAAVLFAFFDALTFPMAAGMLFLLVGLSGAAHTVLRGDGAVHPPR